MRECPSLERLDEIVDQMTGVADMGVAPLRLIAEALADLTIEVRSMRYRDQREPRSSGDPVRGTRRRKVSSTIYMTPEQLENLQIVMKATRRTMTSLISEGLDMAIERREAELRARE